MSFRHEITPDTPLVLGITDIGQGPMISAATLLPHLGEVPMISPLDGLASTQAVWKIAEARYRRRIIPGSPHQAHVNRLVLGVPPLERFTANVELNMALRSHDTHLVTTDASFGYGADRTVVAANRLFDPMTVDSKTFALVPLPETAVQLRQRGRDIGVTDQEIEVVGFLVPEELKDPERKKRRIETLSQREPTGENPLRLAYMTTGKDGTQSMFHTNILADPLVTKWMKEGRMKLDVYLGRDGVHTPIISKTAHAIGLQPIITYTYQPHAEYEVQIFSHGDALTAEQHAIRMAAEADIIVSEPDERIGWALEVPYIVLPGEKNNPNMTFNRRWAERYLLGKRLRNAQNIGTVLPSFFGNGFYNGEAHQDRAEEAKTVFPNNDLSDGAPMAAALIHERLGL